MGVPSLIQRAQRDLWLATLLVASPESEIVAQKLHDERGILVRVLSDIVELSNGILERGACHLASLFRVAKHLVLEHREIQGKTQADWVGHWQSCRCNVGCIIVCLACVLCCRLLGVIC